MSYRLTCQAVRQHLCKSVDTFPTTAQGLRNPTAFSEHFRHAGPIVNKLLADHGKEHVPSLGLVVHARYDTAESPPEYIKIIGSGDAVLFHVFNWMGEGTDGYHYDPLHTV